jgi:hypothetical protein
MKADAAARREDLKAKIDKRAEERDAKAAASEADWPSSTHLMPSTTPSTPSRARKLAVLNALDARVYADEQAKIANI